MAYDWGAQTQYVVAEQNSLGNFFTKLLPLIRPKFCNSVDYPNLGVLVNPWIIGDGLKGLPSQWCLERSEGVKGH